MKNQEQSDFVLGIKNPMKIEADFQNAEGKIIGRGKILCPQDWNQEMRVKALTSLVQIEVDCGNAIDEDQKFRETAETIVISIDLADMASNTIGRIACTFPAASRSGARITFIKAMIEFERTTGKRVDFEDLLSRPALNNTIH